MAFTLVAIPRHPGKNRHPRIETHGQDLLDFRNFWAQTLAQRLLRGGYDEGTRERHAEPAGLERGPAPRRISVAIASMAPTSYRTVDWSGETVAMTGQAFLRDLKDV